MRDLSKRLDRVLNPRTVVVVGDKKPYMWLRNMRPFREAGGSLYSVQVDPNQIAGIEEMGITNVSSLLDVPGRVDLVVCSVPRRVAPLVLADAVRKQVGGVEMFTSGFAETGEELGIQLQDQITAIARDNDLLIVGPNCMGVYNPRSGVRFSDDQPAGEGGNIGFVSQSGTHGVHFSLICAANGLRLSKAISIGNAIVLNAADCLEYFAQDPQTDVVALYVEGVRDGRRFFDVLRETARRKPVVVWKGGRTSAGARATMSHTASLATAQRLWDAVMRQAGVMTATNMDEVVDLVQVLARAKPATGPRVALLAQTGGQSVVISDAFAGAGLEVPALADASYARLAEFFNIVGGSYRNPFDMAGTVSGDQEKLERILEIVDDDPNVDAMALEIAAFIMGRRWESKPEELEQFIGRLTAHRYRSGKPFIAIMQPGYTEKLVADLHPRVQAAGIPVLPSFERAARALRQFVDYHARRTAAVV
jgi:acyl-CoA synthetase (NDP forming)